METIAELRELYRAAEARAARLRLLYVTGRDLAETDPANLDTILNRCAERIAFFVGCRGGRILQSVGASGIPIRAPGNEQEVLATIVIDGLTSIEGIPDREDRDAFVMQIDMIGATIDRIRTEREKAQLLTTLKERERRLEFLLERIFTAQEEERRRVSHELHDGVAQTATALVRMLEQADVNHAEVARGLVAELRRVIAGLRPTLLDDLGLIPALRSLVEGLESAGYKVAVRFEPEGVRLSPLEENALYRVAQEAIMNIHKHSGGPCDVIVEARLAPDAEDRVLRVVDFGKGPSAMTAAGLREAGHNVGIEVMKERMIAIGGTLDWRPGNGKGVLVEARLPKTRTP